MVGSEFYSLASATKGTSEPDKIELFTVESDDTCAQRGCVRSGEHEHTTLSWHGGEYNRENTWISADSDDIIDLSQMH
jgi:hypothetical protein